MLRNESAAFQSVHKNSIKPLPSTKAVFDVKVKCDSPCFVLACPSVSHKEPYWISLSCDFC